MNNSSETQEIYVVVEVQSGVAVAAYSFTGLGVARDCLEQLRLDQKMDEDDIQLFVTRVNELP